MTQEINLAPVIEKLRKGVCRRVTEGRPAVVVDIEATEHFMRAVADILTALSAAPVAETAGEAVDEGAAGELIDVRSLVARAIAFEAHRAVQVPPLQWALEVADQFLALSPDVFAHPSPTPAADSQPLRDVLTSEDFEALITDARTPKWVNGDYTPTEAMVEAGLEYNHRHASEENMVRSFIEMMQQAEIDGLITYAPTPAADADRVRIAVEAWDELAKRPGLEISFNGFGEEDGWVVHRVTGGVNDREWEELGCADTPLEALQEALSALKSTAAQEEGE